MRLKQGYETRGLGAEVLWPAESRLPDLKQALRFLKNSANLPWVASDLSYP